MKRLTFYITEFLQLVYEMLLEVKPLYNLKIIFYPGDVSGFPNTELLTAKEGEMLLSGLKKVINKTCSHKPS